MKSITETKLAGMNIQHVKSFSDLDLFQAGNLTKAYLSKDIPLEFLLNLEGKNPNTAEATMASFDWILLIDDIQMVSGTNEQEYRIPANGGTRTIPLKISVNLLDVLNNETKDALLNFGFNLADAGDKPTRVGLKLKPTLNVGGIPITYPGYINLGTEFGVQE
ncbi:MAG: LEA type 2 family protein [Cytophagales bacterium]|nr:LEA type 2 family protein [Cytophagales bacterium]